MIFRDVAPGRELDMSAAALPMRPSRRAQRTIAILDKLDLTDGQAGPAHTLSCAHAWRLGLVAILTGRARHRNVGDARTASRRRVKVIRKGERSRGEIAE
jgi:hypothetical protein